jgi:histone-lysine N-methyltransferase SETMAR
MEKDVLVHRSIIWYEFKRGKKPLEIVHLLQETIGDDCPSTKTVYNWWNKFRDGCQSIYDSDRSGAPSFAITSETIEIVHHTIDKDPHLSIHSVAELTGLSYYAVQTILTEHLGMSRVVARWVPKLLNKKQLKDRADTSKELLDLYNADPNNFINQLITGDESWFHFFEPETKQQSSQWLVKGEAPPLKSKVPASMGKRMATIFWDAEGIILLEWLPERQTINSTYYIQILEKLKAAVKEKRRGKWSKGVWLQQDNAPPHTRHSTTAAVKQLGFRCLPHPPYSPDLAPSDYWLFSSMKNPLRGHRYSSLQSLASAISQWEKATPGEWFHAGLLKLPERWAKCIALHGGYIERCDID